MARRLVGIWNIITYIISKLVVVINHGWTNQPHESARDTLVSHKRAKVLSIWILGITNRLYTVLRANSHGVPSHLMSINAISFVESMEVGTYHFTHGLKSLIPSMTWLSTWQRFLEMRFWDLCWELVKQNARLDSQPNSCNFFCLNYSRSNLSDCWQHFNGFSRLKSYDFASMLGLGTPCTGL